MKSLAVIFKLILLLCMCQYLTGHAHALNTAKSRYLPPQNASEKLVLDQIKQSKTVEDVVHFLNEEIKLPESLSIVMGAEDGPLYDPETNEIWIPYSFMIEMQEYFAQDYSHDEAINPILLSQDVLLHTLFHEIGHAFIEMMEFPVIGKEEDAVDNLATILLVELYEDGTEIALSAADAFFYENEEFGIDEASLGGEHSLDIQRYYNILCLIYGSAPDQHEELKEELNEDRLESCVETYDQKAASWFTLLDPYLKSQKRQ